MLKLFDTLAHAGVMNRITLGKLMFADGASINGWRIVFALLCLGFGMQAFSQQAPLRLENELLLEIRLDGESLGMDVLGYQRGDDFLMSLVELTDALGFPVAIDADAGTASGWFISEDRQFSLDLANATVSSDRQEWPLTEDEAVVFQGELYVDTKALETWFPLRLSAEVRELYLNVEALEELPVQRRSRRHDRLTRSPSTARTAQYPLQETPYRFIGPHTTRLRLGYSTVRQTPDSSAVYGTNYAALSRGDLGWMTSTISLAGQSGDSLTGARLKLERTAFDGPLGLNHVEIGDVDGSGFRGVLLRGDGGRGETGDRFDNESVSLEGSQLPDWDVELYQNDQLLMIQTTGPDGRYLFEDVPLQFGQNRFELKFFGPHGEIESREEFHYLGVGMLQAGRVSYEVAAVQNGRTVFGVNDQEDLENLDSGVYVGGINVGITRNLTVGAGFDSVEQEGGRVTSSNASLGLSTSRFYSSVNYVNIPFAQNSIGTSFRTQLGTTSLNLGFTRFLDDPLLTGAVEKWRSNIGIDSSIRQFPVKLEIDTIERENSSQYSSVIGTTIPLFRSGRFSSSLWYSSLEERLDEPGSSTSLAGGLSSFHTSISPWKFRLAASYGFKPDTELLQLSADSSLRIDNNMSLDLGIRRSQSVDTTYYSGGINWILEKVAINARVSYDSDERWGGLITLSTTLIPRSGTLRPRWDSLASVGSGTVEVRVFEQMDGMDTAPLSGVDVKGVQAWRQASTDSNGVAYLSRMPAHRQIDIDLEESSLMDGDLRNTDPGVSIIPRPGSIAIVEFPLIRTVELEGHVLVKSGDESKPVSRALVLLKTPEGEVVAQRRTAFDGFFLFDGIEAGDYRLSLDETLDDRLIEQPAEIEVLSGGSVMRGLDFALRPAEQKVLTLGTFAQNTDSVPEAIEADNPPSLASALPEEALQLEPLDTSDTKPLAMPQAEEGNWFVQLGAYGSRTLAEDYWNRIRQDADAFEGKTPRYEPFRNMTRLLVGPGRSQKAANELCQQLKAGAVECLVRRLD